MKQKFSCIIIIGIVFFWGFLPLSQAQTEFLPSTTYRMVDEVLEKDGDTINASLRIIVLGKLSRSSLQRLLQRVKSDVEARVQFQNKASLASITIWAYVSKIHVHSKELWLASLKQAGNTPPQFRFNEAHLTQLKEPPEMRLGISEELRQTIWQELQGFQYKSQVEALKRFPLNPAHLKEPGQFFRLNKQSTLILAEEIAVDPIADMKGAVSLPPQTTITLIRSITFENRLWHYVEASDPLENIPVFGWIDSLTLIRQIQIPDEDYREQIQTLIESIKFGYQAELSAQYQLTFSQLDEILLEGILKNWPLPLELL